jgi:hypothetical protein
VRQGFCAVLLLLAACKGGPLELGESGGGLDSSGGRPRAASEERCLDLAAARALDAECWPTLHVGRWHGFITGDARYLHVLPSPFFYPSGDLLLEVEAQGTAGLTFSAGDVGGSDAPGGDAGAADAGAADAGAACSGCAALPGLVLGFRYQLLGLRMTGGPSEDRHQDARMDFSLTIAEPWSALCEASGADAGACTCSALGCGVTPDSLQATLVLSADGQALRGSVRSESASEALSAGWEFVRE